jgi:hypothetical protein
LACELAQAAIEANKSDSIPTRNDIRPLPSAGCQGYGGKFFLSYRMFWLACLLDFKIRHPQALSLVSTTELRLGGFISDRWSVLICSPPSLSRWQHV